MNEIKRIDTVQQYNDYFGMETLHPLVTVIDAREANPIHFCPKLYNLYAILMKDPDCGTLKYGRSIYDYQQGTMLFSLRGRSWGLTMTVSCINPVDGCSLFIPNWYVTLR